MVAESYGAFVYAPPDCRSGDSIVMLPDEAHHLVHVRRIAFGAEVFATDGEGLVYRCTLENKERLAILECLPDYGEASIRTELFVGVLKGDGNRDVVDAATQLGARRIVFVNMRRCEGRLREEKLEKLRRRAISAIKQCGRARLPEILSADSVAESLQRIEHSSSILLAQQETGGASAPVGWRQPPTVCVFIGPEGGLEAGEAEEIRQRGALRLSLGKRRLRTEEAVRAALSFVLTTGGESRLF